MDFAPFSPQDLPLLPQLAPEQLTSLEKQLSTEFSQLSREYVKVRQLRVSRMLDLVNQALNQTAAHENEWGQISLTGSEAALALKTHFERAILEDKVDFDILGLYERELDNIIANLRLPRDVDPLLDDISQQPTSDNEENSLKRAKVQRPPFPYLFDQVFSAHKRLLRAVENEKDYQIKLVNDNANANRNIVWMQYYREMCRYRRQLIDDTVDELFTLHNRYHHVEYHKPQHEKNVQYYRSKLTPRHMVRACDSRQPQQGFIDLTTSENVREVVAASRDPHYSNLDNHYVSKNPVEILDIRKAIAATAPFVNAQLTTCVGLDEDEIDADLMLMKKGGNTDLVRTEVGDELVPVSMPTSPRQVVDPQTLLPTIPDADDVDDDDDEDDDDEDDYDETPMPPRQLELRRQYRELLALQPGPTHQLTPLPDIDIASLPPPNFGVSSS